MEFRNVCSRMCFSLSLILSWSEVKYGNPPFHVISTPWMFRKPFVPTSHTLQLRLWPTWAKIDGHRVQNQECRWGVIGKEGYPHSSYSSRDQKVSGPEGNWFIWWSLNSQPMQNSGASTDGTHLTGGLVVSRFWLWLWSLRSSLLLGPMQPSLNPFSSLLLPSNLLLQGHLEKFL